MIAAELFVNLGIKGADKTLGALAKTGKGLEGVKSTSLEAKAAIFGALYALERLFSKSGQAGTDLTNFNSVLGVSTKTLQQYQYAARQVGVSNQETENSFRALQSSMTKMSMGEGAPKGYAQVAMLTGGITADDVNKFMQNPELLLQRLQQYAQKEKRLGIRNEALKSFGLSDNMVAALSRNTFTPQNLKKAPTYSEKEIASLDKANIAWSNLGSKIEMAIGRINAERGGQLIKDISNITTSVLRLTDALLKLADTLQIFKGLSKVFEGLVYLTDAADYITKQSQTDSGRDQLKEDASMFSSFVQEGFKSGIESLLSTFISKENLEKPAKQVLPDAIFSILNPTANPVAAAQSVFGIVDSILSSFMPMPAENTGTLAPARNIGGPTPPPIMQQFITQPPAPMVPYKIEAAPSIPMLPYREPAPSIPGNQAPNKNTTQNINVNQSFTFSGDGRDSRQTADTMKKSVQEAFRQLSSQIQGS